MLIALQFPLTDFRRFVETDGVTARLARPKWPLAEAGEFLRASGDVQARRLGGSSDWTGEEVFCGAHRAVRLPGLGRSLPLTGKDRVSVRGVFRRFFSDRACVRRLEMGFSARTPTGRIDGRMLVTRILNLKVRMPSMSGTFIESRLHQLGDEFTTFYLGATTGRKFAASANSLWVEQGDPMIVIEAEPARVEGTGRRQIAKYLDGAITLWHSTVKHEQQTFVLWTIERDVTPANLTSARELRVNLLRWHAEQQSMRKVVRAIGEKLVLKKGSDATDQLDEYLNERISYLERPTRGSTRLGWSEINEVAREATDRMSLVHQQTLAAELVNLRKNIRRKTREFIVQHMHVEKAEIDMSRTFGTINTGGGDFKYAEGDQYNAGRDINIAVKEHLDKLDALVAEAKKQVPAEDAAKLESAAAAVREEATKEKPDESRFRVTAKGLLDAAQAVAGIAAPVATTLKVLFESLFSSGWPF
jgi:hypothetical protein